MEFGTCQKTLQDTTQGKKLHDICTVECHTYQTRNIQKNCACARARTYECRKSLGRKYCQLIVISWAGQKGVKERCGFVCDLWMFYEKCVITHKQRFLNFRELPTHHQVGAVFLFSALEPRVLVMSAEWATAQQLGWGWNRLRGLSWPPSISKLKSLILILLFSNSNLKFASSHGSK